MPWAAPGSIPSEVRVLLDGDRDYGEWLPEAQFRGAQQAWLGGHAQRIGSGYRGCFDPVRL
jgi:hypothetical protein